MHYKDSVEENKVKRFVLSLIRVASLYIAEGIPYIIVMNVTVVMFKRIGLSNAEVALYTSWLYLPWVIKPFWSPIIDMFKTKRWWIITMQSLIAASLAGAAFMLPAPGGVKWALAFFWLMAFSSATHDIAADGFYMLALNQREQAFFVGIRSTAYRLAMILGQGGLIVIAGRLEVYTRQPIRAWSLTLAGIALFFLILCLFNKFMLPKPASDRTMERSKSKAEMMNFFSTFITFFTKRNALVAILFMLLYRFPEALLTKICSPFMLDSYNDGGLGLTTPELGLVQGTVGAIGLTLGGIVGGVAIARSGLKKWLWPMVMSISIPNVVYVYLAYYQPSSLTLISFCIFLEQFGYGFGFTAYMLYLLQYSKGKSSTSHYAFCTGFMALGMMIPGMFAGYLQESVGYLNFFIIVVALVPITFLVTALIKVNPHFGKKEKDILEEDIE